MKNKPRHLTPLAGYVKMLRLYFSQYGRLTRRNVRIFRRICKYLVIEIFGFMVHPRRKFQITLWRLAQFRDDLETSILTAKNPTDKRFYESALKLMDVYLFPIFYERLIPLLYIGETLRWIREIAGAKNTDEIYQSISKRINRVLQGEYVPLFVPFDVDKPQEIIIECLKSGNGEGALEQIEGSSPDQILALFPDQPLTALIHLITTDDGTFAIVTQQDCPIEIVVCPNMTRRKIENLLQGWMWLYDWHSERMYQKTLEYRPEWDTTLRENQKQYEDAAWHFPNLRIHYNEPVQSNLRPTEIPFTKSKPALPFPSWLFMEAILRELGIGYLSPGEGMWGILDKKFSERKVQRIILCPDKALALFPHHAAILEITDEQKVSLLDHYEITYCPQGNLTKIPKTSSQRLQVLAIGTEGEREVFSAIALKALCLLEPKQIVTQEISVRPDGLEDALMRFKVNALTFVGHGHYHWGKPERSWLGLSQTENKYDRVIGLENFLDVVSSRLQLVTLAACGVGLPKIRSRISEYKGFAEDLLLKSQIPTIVSTLWPVHQLCTLLLMRRFHQQLVHDNSLGDKSAICASKALRHAQMWLRNLTRDEVIEELQYLTEFTAADETQRLELEGEIENMRSQTIARPYAHPYFWSAFYVMGGLL